MKPEYEDTHPRGACTSCIHCRPTDRRDTGSGEQIYDCLVMMAELTRTIFAMKCSQHYTGWNE